MMVPCVENVVCEIKFETDVFSFEGLVFLQF